MQDRVDDPAVAEHRHGVAMVRRCTDVGQRGADAATETGDVNTGRQFPGGHPLPVLGALGTHLLDGDVLAQPPVVFGESLVEVDIQSEGGRDRCRGGHGTALRAADQSGDREASQRRREPVSLLAAEVGEVGIRAFPGLRAVRQRVPDEQQLHPSSLSCPVWAMPISCLI